MPANRRSSPTASHVGPPWRLRAAGYALVFRAPTSTLREAVRGRSGGLEPAGGYGALILLDYADSTVGPYRECMILPGATRARVQSSPERSECLVRRASEVRGHAVRRASVVRGHTIARILVTTEQSRLGGQANWAIPKERGRIEWSDAEGGSSIGVFDEAGHRSASFTFRAAGVAANGRRRALAVPFSSRILPHTLLQVWGGSVVRTRVRARGWVGPGRLVHLEAHGEGFRLLCAIRPIAVLRIYKADIEFPAGTRLPLA